MITSHNIIYLIRHAQAKHNVKNDFSIFDPELTEKGIKQCNSIIAPLVNTIITSSSTRAIQTALLLYPDRRVVVTDLCLEPNTGVPCNSRSELNIIKNKFNDKLHLLDFDTLYIPPLSIEISQEQIISRVNMLFDVISLAKLLHPIAIVSHWNFINTVCQSHNVILSKEMDNCGVITLSIPSSIKLHPLDNSIHFMDNLNVNSQCLYVIDKNIGYIKDDDNTNVIYEKNDAQFTFNFTHQFASQIKGEVSSENEDIIL